MSILKLYTDGACSGNQNDENIGGWGTVLEYGENTKEIYGGEINTTNNRMELMAVIEGFKALKKNSLKVEVYTDSSYVADCFRQKWYINWQKNGWKTSQKSPVENQDLWKELLSLVEKHSVSFFRVKGHVNLESKSLNVAPLLEKFRQWNGAHYSMEDFTYITKLNNRADALANLGIAQVKEKR